MGKEVEIWANKNYRVLFDPETSELVYRIKIPREKLERALAGIGEVV